jgi:two-component system chemotaxis response regulator CheB
MKKARVLIVDDSVVIRRLLSEALANDPVIEVVGAAANGRIALQKVAQLNPDLITLDIEMPEMDGLAMLAELRKSHPRLPVIMFSTLTERGAVATLDALALGASDYVTKPMNTGGLAAAITSVRKDLIPKVKALCGIDEAPLAPSPASLAACPAVVRRRPPSNGSLRFDAVAIGVSTGGPNALTEIFRELPADLPVPILIVQHMPPVFTRYLAERLNQISPLPVCEAQDGQPLHAPGAWLAPGGFHMTVVRRERGPAIRLHQGPPENSCRPAVDVLFRSVAETYGGASLAVVLTGMGQDGLRGCEAIAGAGGRVLAQDKSTSVIWGMPGAVANSGLADAVLPLSEMAREIARLVRQRPAVRAAALAATGP